MIKSDETERTMTFVPAEQLEDNDIKVTRIRNSDGTEICLYFGDQLKFLIDGDNAESLAREISSLLDEAADEGCLLGGKA